MPRKIVRKPYPALYNLLLEQIPDLLVDPPRLLETFRYEGTDKVLIALLPDYNKIFAEQLLIDEAEDFQLKDIDGVIPELESETGFISTFRIIEDNKGRP